MAGLLASVLFEYGCVSYQKRPKRLLKAAVDKGQVFDAIIVPGVPFLNNAWDSVMKGRVLWSYILYKNGMAKNIIYSGGAVYSPYFEAKIMGLYAIQLGIPAEHIFYDTLAEHSTENIYYAYELARKEGFKSIALATDPFQSSMMKTFTKWRFKRAIPHLPFVIDSLKQYNHSSPTIDPSAAFDVSFKSLLERKPFLKRLKGTLGMDIPWKQYPSRKVPEL
jgi:uncharacterized SAM-binding protein YcdF (DUF218 family)